MSEGVNNASVIGCCLIRLSPMGDENGWLVSLESGGNVPFDIKRVYYIFGTEASIKRGMHAHRNLEQLIVCVSGSCSFSVDDGKQSALIKMDRPEKALHIRGVIWREMMDFSPDCVLMVLASQHYDESDYIRDYDEFIRYKSEGCQI